MKAHAEADLDHSQLEELVGRMKDKSRQLAERVLELEQQIVLRDDCSLADAADAASLQENRLRARSMVEQHRQTIGEIDAALRRLRDGSYGVSESTGEPISYDRLLLVPWARTGSDEGG